MSLLAPEGPKGSRKAELMDYLGAFLYSCIVKGVSFRAEEEMCVIIPVMCPHGGGWGR